eukprot:6684888-Prymnesium_polylepis.1
MTRAQANQRHRTAGHVWVRQRNHRHRTDEMCSCSQRLAAETSVGTRGCARLHPAPCSLRLLGADPFWRRCLAPLCVAGQHPYGATAGKAVSKLKLKFRNPPQANSNSRV